MKITKEMIETTLAEAKVVTPLADALLSGQPLPMRRRIVDLIDIVDIDDGPPVMHYNGLALCTPGRHTLTSRQQHSIELAPYIEVHDEQTV